MRVAFFLARRSAPRDAPAPAGCARQSDDETIRQPDDYASPGSPVRNPLLEGEQSCSQFELSRGGESPRFHRTPLCAHARGPCRRGARAVHPSLLARFNIHAPARPPTLPRRKTVHAEPDHQRSELLLLTPRPIRRCCGSSARSCGSPAPSSAAASGCAAPVRCTSTARPCAPARSSSAMSAGRAHHHHRRPRPGQRASGAAGLDRAAGPAVRLLPVGPDHAGGRAAGAQPQPDRRRRSSTGMNGNLCRCATYSAHRRRRQARRRRS